MFYNSSKASYFKQIPCNFWARKHSIMTPKTIADYISNHDNDDTNNDNNEDSINENDTSINSRPLPPLAAVGYVLMEQRCSLFGLEYKENPTVILLYKIAKEALDYKIQDHNSTVERLIDVATETKNQFKRDTGSVRRR
ncbi:hypothetical protein BD408DRAFT_409724 [Parasitella parasitica]|nr:hypothetical protein BD408DRAFT_409724 [Parasitella parasitica]